MEFGFYHRLEQLICLHPGNVNTELLQKARCYCAWIFNSCRMDVARRKLSFKRALNVYTVGHKKEPTCFFVCNFVKNQQI